MAVSASVKFSGDVVDDDLLSGGGGSGGGGSSGGGGGGGSANRKRPNCDSHSLSFGVSRDKTLGVCGLDYKGGSNSVGVSPPHRNGFAPLQNGGSKYANNNNNNNNKSGGGDVSLKNRYYDNNKVTSSSRAVRVSPDSQSEGVSVQEPTTSPQRSPVAADKAIVKGDEDGGAEFPDYLTYYLGFFC